MRKISLILLLFCTFSIQASQFYAPNGEVYDLGKCYYQCINELSKVDANQAINIISLAPRSQREHLSNRVLNNYVDADDYINFEILFASTPKKTEWMKRNYKEVQLKRYLKDYNDNQKLQATLNYLQNNTEITNEDYNIQQLLMSYINEKRKSSKLTESEKYALSELNKSQKIDLNHMIQETLYYEKSSIDDLFELLSTQERNTAICETVEELNVSFDEFLSEDCFKLNECIERADEHLVEMKEVYKSYLYNTCNSETVLEKIKQTRNNAIELMKEIYSDEERPADECYDCGIQKYGDYTAETKIIIEAQKIFKITKMWTDGCKESQIDSHFYNIERRAIKNLRKYPQLNITDLSTKNENCKVRFNAINYRK